MSTAASHPAAEAELQNPRGASGTAGTGAPQGGQVPGQDPGLAHPHLVTRPMFYIHAPPPPFLHYQWPMPFYNPFSPFSGVGYGLMMPPFPPAPYMEPPPAYFLPHAPVQPVDYRRMGHPQPHPNSAPYPSHTRRPRPPHTGLVRETVNSEVQTEPREGEYHGGSPSRNCSDSGRGTAPNSPTSSTSSCNPKHSNSEGEKGAKEDSPLPLTCSRGGVEPGSQMPNPREKQSFQTMVKEKNFANSPSLKCRNLHLVRQENVETVDTPHKLRSDKQRRVSVPDILQSWGNETPQEDVTAAHKIVILPSYEDEEEVHFQSSTVVNEELLDVEVTDGDRGQNEQIADPALCFHALENSLDVSIKLCGAGHDTINEATLEDPSESAQTASAKARGKLNESIWSVESLPGFIPTKEWLAQNTTVGPEVIVEVAEEAENGSPRDKTTNQKSPCNSSTDSVQMSHSFIGFSTPASKETVKQASIATTEPRIYKLQKQIVPLDSPICDKNNLADTLKKEERNETCEPASSPRVQSPAVEKLEKSGESNKGKTILPVAEEGCGEDSAQKKDPDGGVEQLPVPIHAVMEVSPSKVDCGVQFPEQQMNRGNMNRKHFHRSADFLNTSTRSEGYYGNGQKKRHFYFKGKDRAQSQQEAFYPHLERVGKPRGGKGRY